MKIYIARTAGFCMGVSRALSKAMSISKEKEVVYTWGPLIHNPQVIEDLKSKNIQVTDSLDGKAGSILVIRSHGVSPQEKELLKSSLAKICDVTCPRVSKVQEIIDRYANEGFRIAIIGDEDHPEVKGLIGYSMEMGHVINSADDVDALPLDNKYCVVSQTTMDQELFEELSSRIKNRFDNVVIFNTICDSTSKRQTEVIELCTKVQAMIVIGGKNSANTTRLAEISKAQGVKAYHIETEKELDLNEISKFRAIGVTGGASTPDWMIERVLNTLEEHCNTKREVNCPSSAKNKSP